MRRCGSKRECRLKRRCPPVASDGLFDVLFERPESGQRPKRGEIEYVISNQSDTSTDTQAPASSAFEFTGLRKETVKYHLGIVDLFEYRRGWQLQGYPPVRVSGSPPQCRLVEKQPGLQHANGHDAHRRGTSKTHCRQYLDDFRFAFGVAAVFGVPVHKQEVARVKVQTRIDPGCEVPRRRRQSPQVRPLSLDRTEDSMLIQ